MRQGGIAERPRAQGAEGRFGQSEDAMSSRNARRRKAAAKAKLLVQAVAEAFAAEEARQLAKVQAERDRVEMLRQLNVPAWGLGMKRNLSVLPLRGAARFSNDPDPEAGVGGSAKRYEAKVKRRLKRG